MTAAELDLVTSIAHTTHGVSGIAKALLDQLGIEEWLHIVRDNEPYDPTLSHIANNPDQKESLLIYPNPVTSTFSVDIKGIQENQDVEIRIFDILWTNDRKKNR